MLCLLVTLICVIGILYKYMNNTYDHWRKQNVPYHPPVTFFGNMKDSIIMKRSLGQIYTDIYNLYKNVPYVGIYKIRQPGLLIRDPAIIKNIMVKDFHNFEKNEMIVDEKVDPIGSKNPFTQYGHRWKVTRSQLSNCFTTGKMKHMFPLMHEVSKNMVNYIESECELGNNLFETKELSSKFTTDNVATCAFGLEANSFLDPNSEFRKIGSQVLQPSFTLSVKLLMILLFPILTKIFKVKFLADHVVNYFRNIIQETLKYREKNHLIRNDFLDVVTQMKFNPEDSNVREDTITSHAISFFADGFETSSINLSFTLYEIAANLDIQQELRTEIKEVLKKHNGLLSYEAIQEMNYLDRVLSESLRMHPPGLFLSKLCTNEYKLPPCKPAGKEITVEVDTPIIIPLYALHYDQEYFPNPKKFDPDRFADNRISEIVKGSYLPFGEGPRICVGMKFAVLQVKIAIVAIVKNFDIRVNKKTREPIEIDQNYFLLLAKGGLWLDFYKRTN